ncbi:hypothetical protein PPACK8108_LOCUS14731 [Phakopsora pachyrhizi]|uniref:Uncharacterized protein n=1 Tax=Phakopsora pachyrhizi TaxID=170000 RepID=A0AAV0B967_PHAPC|nr:hypothetical protein PPACK8108_LOCUS14731 [Phakopsora pachyrhizi]
MPDDQCGLEPADLDGESEKTEEWEEKILDEALVFCSRLERLGLDLSWRDLRLELELAESRARALKRKQAGLLPLPEDEDEGDRSDKTPLLKQSTGDEEGSQHRTEERISTVGVSIKWHHHSNDFADDLAKGGVVKDGSKMVKTKWNCMDGMQKRMNQGHPNQQLVSKLMIRLDNFVRRAGGLIVEKGPELKLARLNVSKEPNTAKSESNQSWNPSAEAEDWKRQDSTEPSVIKEEELVEPVAGLIKSEALPNISPQLVPSLKKENNNFIKNAAEGGRMAEI